MSTDKTPATELHKEALSVYDTLKLALEALKLSSVTVDSFVAQKKTQEAITAIRVVLASKSEALAEQLAIQQGWDVDDLLDKPKQPAPASPSQGDIKPWVGLTQKDKKQIERLAVYVEGAISLTEAKLREKNAASLTPLTDVQVALILSQLPAPPTDDGGALHTWAMQAVRALADLGIMSVPDGKGDA